MDCRWPSRTSENREPTSSPGPTSAVATRRSHERWLTAASRGFRARDPDDRSAILADQSLPDIPSYNGLVTAIEKRRAHGWQAFGSYTYSTTVGLQASSGATAAAAQSSTVALPNGPFGRDPNDLTNAAGRLPNDRPHVFRAMASAEVPKTGMVIAANLQCFSGKPWAATTLLDLPQNSQQRVLIETRGTRRLSSQSLLDVRLFGAFSSRAGRVELLLDVLNASTIRPRRRWRPMCSSPKRSWPIPISVSPPCSWIRAA